MVPTAHRDMELAFRRTSELAVELDSPLYAAMAAVCADDVARRGIVWKVVGGFEGDPMEALVPLRLFRDLHKEALTGALPRLARHYATCGGAFDPATLREDLLAEVRSLRGLLEAGISRPLQTNEPGRSAGLVPAYAVLGERFAGLPMRILEIGTSAGLNLHWPQYGYDFDQPQGASISVNPAATLRLRADWSGPMPDMCKIPAEVSVAGCDIAPIDLDDDTGRTWLRAQVWPEHTKRMATLDAAIEIARANPVRIDREDARTWLARELAEPAGGTLTVVQHTVMWYLLPPEARAEIDSVIQAAAARASADAPLVRLSMELEAAVSSFPVRVRDWTGHAQVLGRLDNHGRQVWWGEAQNPSQWASSQVSPAPTSTASGGVIS